MASGASPRRDLDVVFSIEEFRNLVFSCKIGEELNNLKFEFRNQTSMF